MNPNAKEFVPAHLLKKRQDEAVGELTTQISNVDIDGSSKSSSTGQNNETSKKSDSDHSTAQATITSSAKPQDRVQEKSSSDSRQNNGSSKLPKDGSSDEQQAHPNAVSNHQSRSHNHVQHYKTNGDSNSDPNEDDRYLLMAGENYCEFNGEQFIIPGEDDEYTSSGQDYQHPGYDFGNAEDNEDEDVCNAYEEFLNDLPQ